MVPVNPPVKVVGGPRRHALVSYIVTSCCKNASSNRKLCKI